jgi:hypothetical protein
MSEVEVDFLPEATGEAMADVTEDEVALLRARYQLAQQIASTDFVPSAMRGKPAAVLGCFMAGREIGLGPMASLKHVYIVDGRPDLSAELQLALVRRAGHTVEGEATADRATVTGTRRDTNEVMKVEWTLETALQAGLIDKIVDGKPVRRSSNGRPLPWEHYPQSMLWARAVTQLVGQLFSDVLIGGHDDR